MAYLFHIISQKAVGNGRLFSCLRLFENNRAFFKVYIRNILVLFKLWELYYLQARNSKQLLFHIISQKAVGDGRLFSCLRLFEYNRAFFKVYIRNLLVLFKLWELYYLQARNSKQILFHIISQKAVGDGRLFSCLRLFENNRAFFKVFIRNLLVLFKL